jgi:hypothetical protein
MMVSPAMLEARMAKVTILLAKYLDMRHRVKAFCPATDEAFWDKARARAPQ